MYIIFRCRSACSRESPKKGLPGGLPGGVRPPSNFFRVRSLPGPLPEASGPLLDALHGSLQGGPGGSPGLPEGFLESILAIYFVFFLFFQGHASRLLRKFCRFSPGILFWRKPAL